MSAVQVALDVSGSDALGARRVTETAIGSRNDRLTLHAPARFNGACREISASSTHDRLFLADRVHAQQLALDIPAFDDVEGWQEEI